MNRPPLNDLLAAAQETAAAAGHLLREKWRQPRQLSHKGFREWVTDADYAAQQLITDRIRARFPEHGFLTEEENSELPANGEIIWVIDPVDGTSNYSRQQPNFSLSIAAVSSAPAGEVLAGVIYDPLRREMFSAAQGLGGFLNETPLAGSSISVLEQAIVALDWGHTPAEREYTLLTLQQIIHKVHTLRSIGTAALALAWVAAGRLDAYLHVALHPWDAAAGSLLIREAGGQISNHAGEEWRLDHPDCLASNGQIHQQLRALLCQS